MKNSIGSLAALATLAAAPSLQAGAPPPPEPAAFNNVIVPYQNGGSVYLDIDGDSVNDVRLYSNGLFVQLFAEPGNAFSSGPLTAGNYFSPDDASANSVFLDDVGAPSFTTGYFGVSFNIADEAHAGWIYLDFTGADPLAVAGGWQTVAYSAVEVGNPAPIPEPSAFAALAGAGALLAAGGRRRHRAAS